MSKATICNNIDMVHIKKYDGDDKMFVIDEATLNGDGMTVKDVCETLKSCFKIKYFYNYNFVNENNERLTMDDILKHTHISLVRKNKHHCELATSNGTTKRNLEDRIKLLKNYISATQRIGGVQFRVYNKTDDVEKTDSLIYSKLSDVWGQLQIQDVDDDCPMVDSYCKALGFMLANDRSKRYFVCLYSELKGWGKTSITSVLLKNTNGQYSQYGNKRTTNQFTMANIPGNDFYQIDDLTIQNQTEICGTINNVVSNNASNSEKKTKDEEYICDLSCRILLTTNIPFLPRQDTYGLCDNKMIEITSKARDDLSSYENALVSDAYLYIRDMSENDPSEYDKFYNLCVKMYEDDPEFITRHLRSVKSKDEYLDASIAGVIDRGTLENAHSGIALCKLLKSRYLAYTDRSIDKESRKTMKSAYLKVCDALYKKFNLKPLSLADDATVLWARCQGKQAKCNFELNDAAITYLKERLDIFFDGHTEPDTF